VKHNVTLRIASLLSILLLIFHVTDDIVHGMDKAGPSTLVVLPILVLLLYGTLVLAERRSGYIIMLLGGLVALGMPVLHLRGARIDAIAKSSGGFFFITTLLELGVIGLFSLILSAQLLWRAQRTKTNSVIP